MKFLPVTAADGLDDLGDLRVLEVRRDALPLALGTDDAGYGERQDHRQQACAK